MMDSTEYFDADHNSAFHEARRGHDEATRHWGEMLDNNEPPPPLLVSINSDNTPRSSNRATKKEPKKKKRISFKDCDTFTTSVEEAPLAYMPTATSTAAASSSAGINGSDMEPHPPRQRRSSNSSRNSHRHSVSEPTFLGMWVGVDADAWEEDEETDEEDLDLLEAGKKNTLVENEIEIHKDNKDELEEEGSDVFEDEAEDIFLNDSAQPLARLEEEQPYTSKRVSRPSCSSRSSLADGSIDSYETDDSIVRRSNRRQESHTREMEILLAVVDRHMEQEQQLKVRQEQASVSAANERTIHGNSSSNAYNNSMELCAFFVLLLLTIVIGSIHNENNPLEITNFNGTNYTTANNMTVVYNDDKSVLGVDPSSSFSSLSVLSAAPTPRLDQEPTTTPAAATQHPAVEAEPTTTSSAAVPTVATGATMTISPSPLLSASSAPLPDASNNNATTPASIIGNDVTNGTASASDP